ncbi:uncharacterized protein LOC118207545 isoform X4 [Anguilla anguilla]|uniref:uncharacterized protein LOC118207545 isoform X4 n=1 Tax=Anguilla anguilla TaxID=7936 RepID=UPI0015AAC190|nr:uncharacterized protein LOC118207545 isoform X4 [Anguilla anguilla]
MGQSVGPVSASSSQEEGYSGMLPVLPPPVLEEVFVNVPPKEVVCVCRLVCREWKEVADSAALWREMCRRDRFRPRDITRPPTDWRLFYFLCKKRRNLIKNPSADEGYNGWQILENGGDEWSIEPLSEYRPEGTATKYFVTSFHTCKKCQLIDLVKEGYSQSFMDEIQPDIVISDWYAARWDCESIYEICVELLSRNKEVIRKFCPEPVYIETPVDENWRQMTHVFRDYGRGVCFVRFCHGGKDQKYWKGWYGIRVTNSSVEICPSADSAALWRERCRRDRFRPHDITRLPTDWRLFYFLCKKRRNLLKNPSADEGLNGWQILENGGDEWSIEPLSETRPDGTATKYFVTSYSSCKKYQLIDLVKEGYSQSFMDEIQPDIVISDWYAPRWDCGSMYEICVELLSRNKKVIRKFCPEPVYFEQWNDQKWQQMTHVFRDYGRGVRFVRFCHGGTGTQYCTYWNGIRVTNSSVEICTSAVTRRNLLKNPIAEEGFNGWQILENGGDQWRVEPLFETPEGTATRFFVTSYPTCTKCQLIDLVKEGYSQLFMDENQPDIVISDWYAPRWDCGSMYEICVELLSRNKKVIRKFCPEPVVYEQWNDQKWRQMTHVFRDYGRGVCFVRFCHGGRDTKGWKQWFGIRVTNSSVEICPAADSAALWRERCRRDRIRPHDITRPPTDWPLLYSLCKKRRNLLKNPSADEGFDGWQILENGGDKWGIQPIVKYHPEGTATKCFTTSYRLCKKCQLIDLVKEGYSQLFMDEIQPDIVISDWYAPLWDCGSKYEICVELLSQNKKVIRKFCPEPVFFEQWNDQKWQQMTHVFRDYGQGVCFVRFCHGGMDTQYCPGWNGIRVTNSSVEICTSADSAALWRERCRRDRFRPHNITRRNLLKNPSADEGLNRWQILENGGDQWRTEPLFETPEGTATKYFVTSYDPCKKCQLIDLVKEGYSQSFMDEIQPDIVISDWYAPRWDCGSMYEICVELLSRNKKVIRKFCPEPVVYEQWNDQKWQQMTHVFRDYGLGVRFVRFCHGGKDTQFWKGWFGIRVTKSSVEICPSAPV